MSAPAYGFRNHFCGVAEARGRMPCGDQCDECKAYELAEAAAEICPDCLANPCKPACPSKVPA